MHELTAPVPTAAVADARGAVPTHKQLRDVRKVGG